jgi:hypothetical protein
VIARLCGVAIDARASTRTRDPVELARATRWIAGNLLAIRRHRPVQFVRIESLTDLLSAIAVAPVLVDRGSLPTRWQLALRLLGIPLFEDPTGASVLALEPLAGGSYRVRVTDPHMLAA